MRSLKQIFDLYIDASIHVALAVVALVGVSQCTLHILVEDVFFFFIFFATIAGYNFVKYWAGWRKAYRMSILFKHKHFLVSVCSFIGALFFWMYFESRIQFLIVLLGGVLIAYTLPLPRIKNTLRSIKGIKVIVVALVWTVVTVILPVMDSDVIFSNDVWVETVQRFLFVFAITLPFEIRDMHEDRRILGSIPLLIGVAQTKLLGTLLLIIFFVLEYVTTTYVSELWISLCIKMLGLLSVLAIKEKHSRYFTSFWVEGIPLVWFGLYLL